MTAPICIRFARNLAFAATLALPLLAQPLVTVSPTSGQPTSKTTVGGTGFGASEPVDIYFDTTDLALATTDPGGSFSGIHLIVPGSAVPGTHTITGVGRNSGLTAQTNFLVRTNWAQFRRGHFHHGYNPTENVLNVRNLGSMQLLAACPSQTTLRPWQPNRIARPAGPGHAQTELRPRTAAAVISG